MKTQSPVTAESQEYAFTQMPVAKALAKFMIPVIISQLAFLLLNLADAFFVGLTGDTFQVSAMTITFPVIQMMSVVATTFAAGGNAAIASALGIGNAEKARKTAVFSIYTSIGIVVIYSLLVLFFREPIFRTLGASDHSIGHCRKYVFWALVGSSIPFTFNQVISQLFLAEGESRIAGLGIAAAGIINIVLDPIFVFSFNMGVEGAGAATCLSNWIVFIYYLYQHFKRRKTTVVDLHIKDYSIGDNIAASVLSVGVPAGLVLFLANICDFVRNYYLGSLGSDIELAAWGAVQKVSNALMIICVGIGQGARPLLAYNYAAGKYKRTRSLVKGAFIVMLVYESVALILVHLFPETLVSLFVKNEQAIETAVFFLEVWTYAIIGIGLLELFNAIFQAFGKWKLSLANIIIDKGFMLIPVLIAMVKAMGIHGIAYSQIINENLTAFALIFVYLHIAGKMGKNEAS